MPIDANGRVKSGAKDTAGEKGVTVNEHDQEKDVKGTNGEMSANRTLMYRDLIMARGLGLAVLDSCRFRMITMILTTFTYTRLVLSFTPSYVHRISSM